MFLSLQLAIEPSWYLQWGSKSILHFLKVKFLKQGITYSYSINILLNHNVLVATSEKSNEIIIQIKKWQLF